MSEQLYSKEAFFQIIENKRDYTVVVGKKVYKINAIGSCTYLGNSSIVPPKNKKISFQNAPSAIKNKIFGILEKYYGY
ncbi:hypothetical protein [Orenia marismortui]|uniref:Uncharacterized protein n=1 Tax=Orenia marismortui TaxID=46469 RepID=A0A4V3GWE2_9FIRM|nr:hypothetical protein [Orenia marismortui]TDX43689.1 hypothetical protein C7959_1615 [Orenia marismortui]